MLDGSEKGKELVVTIEKVQREHVTGADGKKEECTVCHLKGTKPMILNATNQKTMTKIFDSPYIDDWVGKRMTLYVAKVRAFGETVDALRVKDKLPSPPQLTPQHERWEGARKAIKEGNTTIDAIKLVFKISTEHEKMLLA